MSYDPEGMIEVADEEIKELKEKLAVAEKRIIELEWAASLVPVLKQLKEYLSKISATKEMAEKEPHEADNGPRQDSR